jgi:hypothetical protein
MSREIKFRVWDTKQRTMYQENIYIAPKWLPVPSNPDNCVWHVFTGYYEDGREGHRYSKDLGVLGQDAFLMQYAGFKNGDGAELYHKDIVLVAGHYSGDSYMLSQLGLVDLVEWVDDGWAVIDKNGDYICGLWEYVYNYAEGTQGNIHENPELLEKP